MLGVLAHAGHARYLYKTTPIYSQNTGPLGIDQYN